MPSELSPLRAAALVGTGAILLDVREPHEWNSGHAPDALLMPMAEVDLRLGELDRDQTAILVCRSGVRPAIVTDFLTVRGYSAVNLGGGMLAWAEAGLPVITAGGDPGHVI